MQKVVTTEKQKHSALLSLDKINIIFGLVAIVAGIVISIAAGQFGWIVLFAIPGILILVSAISKPDVGIAMLMFVVFAQVQRVMSEINGLPGPGKPLVGFVFIVIVLRFMVFNERPINWVTNSLLFGGYAIFLLLSVVTADNTDTAYIEFIDVIQNLAIASMILFVVQNTSSLKNTVRSIIVAGLFMSAISVIQNITKTYSYSYFGFGGWEYSGYVDRPRMTGPYETPNPYAQVLAVIFILAFERALNEYKTAWRIVSALAAGLIALAIIFTDSRGGFLNFVFTVFVFFLFNRPNIPAIFITFAVSLLILQFLPSNYTARLLTLFELNPFNSNASQLTDESFRGRTSENLVAWRMFLDNPVLGVGLDNYSQYYLDYSRQIGLDPRREARDPASLYLQLLANQGLLGTTIFLALIALIFVKLGRTYIRLDKMGFKNEAFMTSALFAAMAGYMFMSIYKNSANTNVFWSLVALCLAASQVGENIIKQENEATPNSKPTKRLA